MNIRSACVGTVILLAGVLQLGAAELSCSGVLGNSGGQGPALLRHGQGSARGLGLAADRFGCLWDRAGKGVLIRCTPDGRMVARYRIPDREDHYRDRIAIAGDRVVLLLRGELWTLPLDAPADSEATSLGIQAEALAPTTVKGRVLVGDHQGLTWIDPASGAKEAAGPGYKGIQDIDVASDGTIYATAEWKIHAVRDGKDLADGWPKPAPGEKPQLIDGFWYSHGWHSTIKRHDASLAPAPGVVLGGNSGSFIGHVDESPDIVNGRGMLHLADGEWAVGGFSGGICLLGWDGGKRQFALLRRIGAVPEASALGLDGQGRVTLGYGWWNWSDTPDAPLREGPGTSGGRLHQLAPLGGGRFASTGIQYGDQPRIGVGKPEQWRFVASQEQKITVPGDVSGVAAVPGKDDITLIAVTRAGKATGFALAPDGGFRGVVGEVALTTAVPAPAAWTSLAVDPQGRLLAAADGQILIFERAGEAWQETRRWRTWSDAPADGFGAAVWIQVDGDRLWVADRDRHRVLCFPLAGGKPLASFGTIDQRGDDLGHLDAPQMLAPNGDRCVVHDAGNQRLIKLILH
ncbi:MAG: hypothetical protein H0W72_03650 [Planctomycetes bacterium]|nr:hypothetical protein [Planctomycetota bacterium]